MRCTHYKLRQVDGFIGAATLLPQGGFRGDDELPPGGFRSDDELPPDGVCGVLNWDDVVPL